MSVRPALTARHASAVGRGTEGCCGGEERQVICCLPLGCKNARTLGHSLVSATPARSLSPFHMIIDPRFPMPNGCSRFLVYIYTMENHRTKRRKEEEALVSTTNTRSTEGAIEQIWED
jgi:hypothetical protein